MVADSVPVTVPAAWQPRGEIFTGEDARPGQQQRFNHLNPASIDAWIVRVRAYLRDRECLDAIVSPQVKDAAAFTSSKSLGFGHFSEAACMLPLRRALSPTLPRSRPTI